MLLLRRGWRIVSRRRHRRWCLHLLRHCRRPRCIHAHGLRWCRRIRRHSHLVVRSHWNILVRKRRTRIRLILNHLYRRLFIYVGFCRGIKHCPVSRWSANDRTRPASTRVSYRHNSLPDNRLRWHIARNFHNSNGRDWSCPAGPDNPSRIPESSNNSVCRYSALSIKRPARHPSHLIANSQPVYRSRIPPSEWPRLPNPSEYRREKPISRVIRQPTPGLEAHPGPSKSAAKEIPAAIAERRPVIRHAVRLPAISISRNKRPVPVA